MYTAYFGLNENPFSIAPDPLYLFMSERHREALAHLQYGIRSDGGFVLLTGEVGAGKTTLCRSLLEQLPEDVDVAYILNPKVSAVELLESICDELQIDRLHETSIKQLVDRLNSYLLNSYAAGRKTVLVIDEAQNLSIEVLEQLRLLTNLETNRYKLLQIVLLGQPELLQILGRREMRQLSQRITARFHLGPLDLGEIGAYVQHRLKIAGCDRSLFPDSLQKSIWQLSGGLPRMINLICDRSLLGAYAREHQVVDGQILRQAAHEVLGDIRPQGIKYKPVLAGALAGLLLVLLSAGLWSWLNSSSVTSVPPSVAPVPSPPAKEPTSPVALSATQIQDKPVPALARTWPQDFAVARSKEGAFADLIGLWGIEDVTGRLDYCSFAREQGLECLARTDSLETLRSINRPAVLTLYGDDGAPFHVVLAGLDNDRALFIAGEQEYEMHIAAIASRWFGNYLMLWQRPPIARNLLKPGQGGDAVPWLAQTLGELGLYQPTGREVVLEGTLLGAFKRFQFINGLTPDGVLGTMSLIHLNTARNLDGPHLKTQGAD